MRIKISIVLFLLVSLFSKGQKIDSIKYFANIDSLRQARIDFLRHKARHNRHGLLIICVDTDYKPVAGVKIYFDSIGKDYSDTTVQISSADSNGACLYQHVDTNGYWYISADTGENKKKIEGVVCAVSKNNREDIDVFFHDYSSTEINNFWKAANLNSRISEADTVLLYGYIGQRQPLRDSITETKYIFDTVQECIIAVDDKGKPVWETTPSKELVNQPSIVDFHFAEYQGREVLAVLFHDTRFGYIDKKTGNFILLGRKFHAYYDQFPGSYEIHHPETY